MFTLPVGSPLVNLTHFILPPSLARHGKRYYGFQHEPRPPESSTNVSRERTPHRELETATDPEDNDVWKKKVNELEKKKKSNRSGGERV